MDRYDSDPRHAPAPVRLARPLIDRFVRSADCPPVHRWHARTSLPVLALVVAMGTETCSNGLRWGELEPEELLRASLDTEPEELDFLRDLLDVSASFYGFLAREGLVSEARSRTLRAGLARLALGLCRR